MGKKQILTIEDAELDAILERYKNDDFAYDNAKIVIDGITYYRKSIVSDENTSTKSTANSLIKKEPVFDYSFMDDVYFCLDNHDMDAIKYARCMKLGRGNHESDFQYQIDLYSAYPHILKYEELPTDGDFLEIEDPARMNFYKYSGKVIKDGCIITDDLKDYVVQNNLGNVEFLFSTRKQRGSKIGEKLIEMVYKNKKTKAEAKLLHYGYYQKKFIQYDRNNDCYIRNAKYNHELLMVAICSQLCLIMLKIAHEIEAGGRFVVDAYFFKNAPDCDKIAEFFKRELANYDFRIIDTWKHGDEDKHGAILYKSYPDLKEAPRSHHKKK